MEPAVQNAAIFTTTHPAAPHPVHPPILRILIQTTGYPQDRPQFYMFRRACRTGDKWGSPIPYRIIKITSTFINGTYRYKPVHQFWYICKMMIYLQLFAGAALLIRLLRNKRL